VIFFILCIFNYGDAREFISDYLFDYPGEKCVVGFFTFNNSPYMDISYVESIGFKGDKKTFNQLNLFK